MTDARIILSTAGSREEADRLASALVEQRLAACVNVVGPVASTYRWQDKVERAEEFLLVIKTSAARFPEVAAAIKGLHSYELPECIEFAVTAGSDAYLEWLTANVSAPK
ncbi:MAG: divalent-cation tolerance protein CutA [Candidatus Koribacter versatilis]|uniref:Divalent-cation tolerance protein CutA n=1 Tax=Candidatus Korobacter versatilis TaxID=658062 RepID=A0A932A9B5_9BACT|nr:divalent-cation tolerance protein CutA [Candidatus Koribacter versatilis]